MKFRSDLDPIFGPQSVNVRPKGGLVRAITVASLRDRREYEKFMASAGVTQLTPWRKLSPGEFQGETLDTQGAAKVAIRNLQQFKLLA